MIRRLVVAALVVYVALDLSLPEMPGAFEFDPAESVDGIQAGRVRLPGNIVLPIPATESFMPWQRARGGGSDRPRPRSLVARPARTAPSCLPRATCALPGPSEDPH